MTKQATELLLLSLFLIIAVLLYRSTAAFPEMVQHSTATYIRFLAVCFGGLCLLEIVLWLKKQSTSDKGKNGRLNITETPARFWGLLVLMFVYSMLLEPLGFYIGSLFFLPAAMYLLGTRKTSHIIFTSAGVLVFVYLVFDRLLGVPLPESSLF
ncbi:tripartite tricarboxylate transporter TctB family protein [Desulfomarina sp.]